MSIKAVATVRTESFEVIRQREPVSVSVKGVKDVSSRGNDKNDKIIQLKKLDGRLETLVVNQSLSYRVVKRGFDIVLSFLALIVLSPVFLITSIAIKMEDGDPVIFTQERSGMEGKPFKMFKFRSMIKNAPEMHESLLEQNELDGPAFKMKDDPRVTKVGKVIRRTSIDELPQFVNVLKGEMSIVGPRPLPTYEQKLCDTYQNQRLLMKPGITCYWQVSGRNDISFDEWIEMDLKYISEASLWTDTRLIGRTIVAVVKMIGAY